MSTKMAYKNKVEISYINGSESVSVDQNKINYVVIEHMYEDRVMPVIYISISIESDLYQKIINNKETAKIYLRIQKYDAYSNTSVYKDYIKGQFTYFLSSSTPEYSTELSESNANIDSNYKTITIGLLDMTIMNTLRRTFSGIVKNIDQHTLVYMAVEDTKIIMKTPTYNLKYDNLIIPSLTSRKKMLDFIFDTDPFYNTELMYFIDFNTSYLIDRSGEAVSANDGTLDNILIDIRNVTTEEAYNEGMEIHNGNYYFYVNPGNTNISIDVGTEKVANQLVAGDDYESSIIDLNINKTADSSVKQTVQRMGKNSGIVYKNAVESAQVCIELVKESIDSSIITPNKAISVNSYEGFDDYSGKYILLYKKEVIQGASNDFASILTIGIKKLGNIQKIGSAMSSSSASNSKTTSTTAKGSKYSTSTYSGTSSKKTTTSSSSSGNSRKA